MLYEMLVGELPGMTAPGEPLRLRELDERVDGLLRRALAPDPDGRFVQAADLERALMAARLGS